MAFSAAMLMFAIFPYFVLILGDIAGVLDPVNFIFLSQIKKFFLFISFSIF